MPQATDDNTDIRYGVMSKIQDGEQIALFSLNFKAEKENCEFAAVDPATKSFGFWTYAAVIMVVLAVGVYCYRRNKIRQEIEYQPIYRKEFKLK